MLKMIAALPFILLLSAPIGLAAGESLLLHVNTDSAEESNLDTQDSYQALADYLSHASGVSIKLVLGQNATTALARTRTGYYAILLGPAHVIGSALKYGYEPVAKFPGSSKTVFVTLRSSNIRSLEQAQGTRLGLPHADSLPTYLAQGEANAVGIQIKSYFKRVSYSRYQDSALFALGIQQQDVAAVDAEVAKKWLAQNAGVIIAETPAVPNLSVAINSKMVSAVQQDKIRAALLRLHIAPQAALLQRLKTSKFEPAGRDDFTYVATLGYFTPKILPGVGVINADQAKALMGQGVPLFDVRTEHEYKRSHIQHAINLPYLEKSAKAVDFDAALDVFDITRLPLEKTAPMIFACNGAECWKSYKSAKLALAHKYTRVYWYRDGYPEWLARSYPVE